MSPANHKIHSGKKILCGLIPILSFFGSAVCVHADSVSTNAVYDGIWHGSLSGTPGAVQTNTFNSTGGNPALTVTGGVAAILFDATNNFNGSVVFQGDNTGNSTVFLFDSTNTFTGNLTVNFDQNAQAYNSNNQISGTATVDGNLSINNQSAGNTTNTINELIVEGSGNADLSNSASGSLVNTVTTLKITDSAVADLTNYGSGSMTNTVTTLSLSGGTLRLGGGGSTTAISTMNWSGGEVDFIYSNGSFGSTHVQNLTVSGPVSISLQDSSQTELTSPNFGSTQILLTVDSFSGDPSQIQLLNGSPFTEVIDPNSTTGITVGTSGTVRIQLSSTFTVSGNETLGGTAPDTVVNGLTFTPGSSLDIFNTLNVLNGPVNLVPNSSIHLGTSSLGNATLNASQLNVAAGAKLSGNGTIGGNVVNSGTVSPGNSPGQIHVGGNYTQTSTGLLKIEVAGRDLAQHDLLSIDGTASLSGTLQLVRLDGFKLKRAQAVTFLTANGGVDGKFATIENGFSTDTILEPTVVYHADSVALEATQGSFARFADGAGLTSNQKAVASALDSVAFRKNPPKAIDYLDGRPLSKLPGDFDKIAPEELTSIFTIGTSLATVQSQNIQRRTDDIRSGTSGFTSAGLAVNGAGPSYSGGFGITTGVAGPTGENEVLVADYHADPKLGVFLSGTGEWVSVGDTDNARGYDLTSGGFTLGVDYKVTPNLAVGLAAGYTGSSADLTDRGRVYVNGGKIGLYATFFQNAEIAAAPTMSKDSSKDLSKDQPAPITIAKGFYADVAVFGGYNSYDTRRSALQGEARADTDGGEVNALAGIGYDFKKGGLTFGPTATFNYTYLGTNEYTEHGSLAPLDIRGGKGESLRTAFGFKASYDWKVGSVLIKPEIRAAWQHEFGDAAYALDSNLAGEGGGSFLVNGPKLGRDSVLVGAGVAIQCSERVSTYVYYDGELGRTNYESNSVTGGIRVAF